MTSAGASVGDFSGVVELPCVVPADRRVTRLIPVLLVQGFAIWLIAALALGLMFPKVAAIAYLGGLAVAAAICVPRYFGKRNELRHTYGELQRLVLHPGGLRRFDESVVIDMPWTHVAGWQYRNSALPGTRGHVISANPMGDAAVAAARHAHTEMGWGIVGGGTVTPLPGAAQVKLRTHDRIGGSNLAAGQPFTSPNCLIFPAEFEVNWSSGVIAAWLRHYRPDVALPA